MSQSWLAEECRQQAVLFLAVAAYSRHGKTGEVSSGCPEPLLAAGSSLQSLVTTRAGVLPTDAKASEIAAWVQIAFEQHATQTDAGIPLTPWKRVELVRWWLAAGKSLAAIDALQRAPLVRVTRGVNEPIHPALWCAERFDRFSLSMDAFNEDVCDGDWLTAAGGPGYYRRTLFKWVMLPNRRRPGLAKDLKAWVSHLQGEMRDIVNDAVALFGVGQRLRSGGELSLVTSDKWIAQWTEGRVGGRVLNEIRRPVIYPTAKGTLHLVKGVVVMPNAETLVAELAALQAAGGTGNATLAGNLPSLDRATTFAWACWKPKEMVSKFWGKAGDAGPGLLPPEKVESAFLAVARWLTAAQVIADLDGPATLRDERGELIEATRIALAIEGFRVQDGRRGTRPLRAIPLAAGMPDPQQCLEFTRESSACKVPLGYLDEPASCPPTLFAAIEALDWRLWALTAAPWNREQELTGAELEIPPRPQVLRSDDWEAIKRQALHVSGGAADEEPLAKLFTYAHERRMAFELSRTGVPQEKPAAAMLDGLIEECGGLAQESLAALVKLDPAAVLRLDPPRRSDGVIDLAAWLTRGGPARDRADDTTAEPVIPYRLRWSREPRPRGELLEERRVGTVVEVLISAGDATDTELAILNAPVFAGHGRLERPEEPSARLAELLTGLRATFAFPAAGQPATTPGNSILALRTAFAGEAAAAFHELITRCRAGEETARAWCRILQADPGFAFACHPGIDIEAEGRQPPALDDPFLSWEFDDTVSAGQDLEVWFAMTPVKARRLISLGQRKSGSLADRAELLAAACQRAGGTLARLGTEAREATHRWMTFGVHAPNPVGTVEPLLDELLKIESAPAGDRTAIFAAAADWCEAIDHQLVPSAWRAEGRLLPAACPDLSLEPDFDNQAPTGTIVIRRFGLRGVHGWPFSGAVSAGPTPGGFCELRACAERLDNSRIVGDIPSQAALNRAVAELAKHSLAGTLTLALPNLFDRLWEAIAGVADPVARAEVESATPPLFEMLKGCCRMIPFEPAKIGDYSAGWVREADGAQPRGRRIKRLVRPGLRTIENVLVRPALVITE